MSIPYHHVRLPRVWLYHDKKYCTSMTTRILWTIGLLASRVGAKAILTYEHQKLRVLPACNGMSSSRFNLNADTDPIPVLSSADEQQGWSLDNIQKEMLLQTSSVVPQPESSQSKCTFTVICICTHIWWKFCHIAIIITKRTFKTNQ